MFCLWCLLTQLLFSLISFFVSILKNGGKDSEVGSKIMLFEFLLNVDLSDFNSRKKREKFPKWIISPSDLLLNGGR